MINIWMYATPVIYPVNFIPAQWRWILIVNPLACVIQRFRSALFAQQFHWTELIGSTVLVGSALVYSLYSFRKMQKEFADII